MVHIREMWRKPRTIYSIAPGFQLSGLLFLAQQVSSSVFYCRETLHAPNKRQSEDEIPLLPASISKEIGPSNFYLSSHQVRFELLNRDVAIVEQRKEPKAIAKENLMASFAAALAPFT